MFLCGTEAVWATHGGAAEGGRSWRETRVVLRVLLWVAPCWRLSRRGRVGCLRRAASAPKMASERGCSPMSEVSWVRGGSGARGSTRERGEHPSLRAKEPSAIFAKVSRRCSGPSGAGAVGGRCCCTLSPGLAEQVLRKRLAAASLSAAPGNGAGLARGVAA